MNVESLGELGTLANKLAYLVRKPQPQFDSWKRQVTDVIEELTTWLQRNRKEKTE